MFIFGLQYGCSKFMEFLDFKDCKGCKECKDLRTLRTFFVGGIIHKNSDSEELGLLSEIFKYFSAKDWEW